MTWVQAETEHLIPIVGLYDLKKELYNTLVEPYLGIFEDGLREVIYRHFVPSKSVFQHEQTPILSSLDSQRVFNAIFRSFRKPLLTPPVLLLRMNINFSLSKFQNTCSGKKSIVFILKTKFGRIFGAYIGGNPKNLDAGVATMNTCLFSLTETNKPTAHSFTKGRRFSFEYPFKDQGLSLSGLMLEFGENQCHASVSNTDVYNEWTSEFLELGPPSLPDNKVLLEVDMLEIFQTDVIADFGYGYH
ncbi:hypothetical protein BDR26DRAFT_987470 [Obelidium mucronatum]|nr:hypothetical protein BDR26DRAFT_987470 [Obelidium mucronatum]